MWYPSDLDYAQQEKRMTCFSEQFFICKTEARGEMVINSVSFQVNTSDVMAEENFVTALEANICVSNWLQMLN